MALPEETPRVLHDGNGTRGPFPLSVGGTPISFADGSQILITRYDADGVGTPQVEGTHYELSAETALPDMGDASRPISTASFTFKLAQPVLAVGQKVLARRVSTVEQALVLALGGGFSAPANERNLDAIIRIAQELTNKLDRVVTINALDANGALELPAEADRAGKFFTFDDDGNPTAISADTGLGDMLAANNLSDVESAGTARANLGLGSAALLASSAVFQVSNNLSEGNATTMRTNLGLGSIAVLSVTDVVSTAMTPVVQAASVAQGAANLNTINAINVKSATYGATGDGATDDTAAFAAALLVGGDIFVPDGTYVLTSINLSVAGTRLFGGRGAVLKFKNSSANLNMIRLTAARCSVEGLSVNGNKASVTYSYNYTTIFIGAADCRVQAVRVYDAQSMGILIGEGGVRPTIQFNEVTAAGDFAIFANDSGASVKPAKGLCLGNTVIGWGSSGTTAVGIGIRGTDWRVEANYVEQTSSYGNSQICIEVWTGGDRCVVADNLCLPLTYCEFGISMAAPNGNCSGNIVKGSTEYGIEIGLAAGISVTGNTIVDATGSAIALNVQASYDVHWTIISDNIIDNCTGSGVSQASIIIDGASELAEHVHVCGNIIRGTATGIRSRLSLNAKISDNTIYVGAVTKAGIDHAGDKAQITGNKLFMLTGATHTNALLVDGDNIEVDGNVIDGSSATTNGIVIASGSENVSVRMNKVRGCTNSIVSNSAEVTVYIFGNLTDGVVTLQSANISWGAPWKFMATKGGTDQTGIAAATPTKVTFTTEVSDIGDYYDNANSRWTPPAGWVEVGAHFYANGLTATAELYVRIYKNGSMIRQVVACVSGSFSAGPMISVVDLANGTDYYEVYVLGASGGTITVTGSANNSCFWGRVL